MGGAERRKRCGELKKVEMVGVAGKELEGECEGVWVEKTKPERF